jgi:serine/threonine protein kinase
LQLHQLVLPAPLAEATTGKLEAVPNDIYGITWPGGTTDVPPDSEVQAAVQGPTTYYLVMVFIVVMVLLCMYIAGKKYIEYANENAAVDFEHQLQQLAGSVDALLISEKRIPRELKRDWVTTLDRLGKGNFGEVWKGTIMDGGNTSVPEYLCAVKIVSLANAQDMIDSAAGAAAAEDDLLKEALLMAQVDANKHLVSMIGVVTRGRPKMLVLSFCEYGELHGVLQRRAANGNAFDLQTKYRFCHEIADGMGHLHHYHLVHRDLATRNVLLASGMVAKVADFGLSRTMSASSTDDNEYYRSKSGIIPVRWTSPEGLIDQKFSSASDVWSFGITCVEILLDGRIPYPDITSNPAVINMVAAGVVHPQPDDCSDRVYAVLFSCWNIHPPRPPLVQRAERIIYKGRR